MGDLGFALGIFLIFYLFGTVNYDEVFKQIPSMSAAGSTPGIRHYHQAQEY